MTNYYVITMMDNERSTQVARRCIESGKKLGYNILMFKAFTPDNCNPEEVAIYNDLPLKGFEEKYSRTGNCISGFLSHFHLWKLTVANNTPTFIFEHDAVILNKLPDITNYDILSVGKPSYGNFNIPTFLGEGPLTSKRYFPGAHGYRVTPKGAQMLIDEAKHTAGPTDVFIHVDKFQYHLGETYPWSVEANDSFTTIQRQEGCLAKHNYGETYEII